MKRGKNIKAGKGRGRNIKNLNPTATKAATEQPATTATGKQRQGATRNEKRGETNEKQTTAASATTSPTEQTATTATATKAGKGRGRNIKNLNPTATKAATEQPATTATGKQRQGATRNEKRGETNEKQTTAASATTSPTEQTATEQTATTARQTLYSKKKSTVFRFFLPIIKNQKYPESKTDKFGDLFVDQSLPKSFEVDILNQMFDIKSLYSFKDLLRNSHSNKEMLQFCFIKKYMRTLTNIHNDQVKFFVIERFEDLFTDESKGENEEGENKDNNNKKEWYELVELNECQAILRIKNYLRNKVSKLPKDLIVQKSNSENPFKTIRKCTKATFEELYSEKDLLNNPNDTDHYSVIHSICEGFDFIVYDRSHKLKSDVPIHQCLKIRLSFPPIQNMFIIFNGHTAHCGAAAIQEPSLMSFAFQNSFRLFSYVSKSLDQRTTTSTDHPKTRKESKRKISDQETFKMVDKTHVDVCVDCEACNKNISKLGKKPWYHFGTLGIGHYRLDLNDCYSFVSSKGASRGRGRASAGVIKRETASPAKKKIKIEQTLDPIKIAGDLEENGWAVYAGVDVSSMTHFGVMDEIEKSINKCGNKSKWTTIDRSSTFNQNIGERLYLKFNEDIGKKSSSFECTNSFFQSIQSIVRNIPNFENAVLKKHSFSILRNDGNINEQFVHRDETTIEH